MSCLDEKNPYIRNQLTQICFFAQQYAHKIVSEYSKSEIYKRAKLRNILPDLSLEKQKNLLEDMITREMYILEMTNLPLWTPEKLKNLAKKLKLDTKQYPDTVHLAWMIALVIIRDKIPYKFNKNREIVILSTNKKTKKTQNNSKKINQNK
jgi:hypothetical protein